MNITKQIKKIAELDGFSDVQFHRDYGGSGYWDGVFENNPSSFRSKIPPYLEQLNSIRAVILGLSYEDQIEWTHHLGEALGWENPNDWTYIDMILAPAEKWCEALLKMKGLWDEE